MRKRRSPPPSAPTAGIWGRAWRADRGDTDWLTRGHRPVYPVSFTGEENRLMSPISAAIVKPVIQPIPGAVISSGM